MIEEGMPTFSKGQKRIANYILEHYDKAAYMTASKLGTLVGVSESTVVRFANELGFEFYDKELITDTASSGNTELSFIRPKNVPIAGTYTGSVTVSVSVDVNQFAV